jgi:hypothetical protein
MRFAKMANSTNFRIEIRHCTKPFEPYFWEIFSVSKLKRVKRSSRTYPTRGAAMKAGKKALLRFNAMASDEPAAVSRWPG